MKKIGEGYYYNVYDLGNGRVLKRQKNAARLFMYILFSNRFKLNTFKEYRSALKNIPHIKDTYIKIQNQIPSLDLIGNPHFLNGINYEQDKVTILRDLLTTTPDGEMKIILDAYIDFIKELWKYGIHELVYNFSINSGVDRNGKLVMVDFNEISFDVEEITKQIEKKIWLQRWSYAHLNPTLKNYYRQKMDEEVTVQHLRSLWRTKVI